MYSPILEDTHTLLHIHVVVRYLTIFAPHATRSSVHPKSRKHREAYSAEGHQYSSLYRHAWVHQFFLR